MGLVRGGHDREVPAVGRALVHDLEQGGVGVGAGAAGIQRRGVGGGWALTRMRRIDVSGCGGCVPIENARDFSFSVAFPAVIHTCDAKSGMTKARTVCSWILPARIWVLG